MFVGDAIFDDDDRPKGFKQRSISPNMKNNVSSDRFSNSDAIGQELENEEPAFGSAGVLGTPSSSRARMLAQQRELQLKNRQKAMQSGGMIRSSQSPLRASADSQFTPAVRQFSAPKSVADSQADGNADFRIPPARKPVPIASRPGKSRFSDDEDDDDDDNADDYRRSNANSTAHVKGDRSAGPPRGRFDEVEDDDEDDEPYERRRGNRSAGNNHWKESNTSGARGYRDRDREDDDDDDDDYEDRAGNRDRDRDRGGSKWTSVAGRNDKGSRDRDRDREITESQMTRSMSGNPNTSPIPAVVITPPNLTNMRQFLMSPVPKNNGVVQCYIRRNKSGTNKLFPLYQLYLKDGDRFLMVSKKRPNNKTSNYLISMGEGDLNRESSNYLGKLRSNFVGTEFQVFDNGSNPSEGDDSGGAIRKELGAVMYAANVLGSRGPRKMQVAIPAVHEDGTSNPRNPNDEILTHIKEKNLRDLVYLINKPPRWNEQVGAYVLNFNGRVTMASVKNFQLVDPDEQNTVVLQFGRVAKDEFTMDMQWPITPFQAFAITLSSFDSKIACD